MGITKVIMADDHAVVGQALSCLLEREPDVQIVAQGRDGTETLRLIREWKPDVAVMDLLMPGKTGIEVAEEVRRCGLQTRIVLLTMHIRPELLRRAMGAGIRGYVLKINGAAELLEAVRVVREGGRFFSRTVLNALVEDYVELSSSATPADPLEGLSERERQVLIRHAQGRSTAEISEELRVSPKTVETYRSRIKGKLGVQKPADLMRFAYEQGLINPAPEQ